VGALCLAIGRHAAADGILGPLLVGVGLRLAVMVIAHVGSLSLGDRGILFIDDQTYFRAGSALADVWRAGHTPDPTGAALAGTYQLGYQLFLGVLFTLGTSSILLGKFANVLLGGLTVFVTARLAGRVIGEHAKRNAAWLTALAPTLVWWSAPLLKEALATFLLAVGVLAVTWLPRARAVATLAVVMPALLVLRGAGGVALAIGAAVGIAVAARQAEGRWLSRPLKVFGIATAAGLLAVALVVSHGHPGAFYAQYRNVVADMFHVYQGGNVARAPYDTVKSLVTPLPWTFDRATRYWDRGLYPGMWLLFCAYPLAAAGAWRLRRRPEMWAVVVAAATSLVVNALTTGFAFRQRSMIEPLLLLLALAGARSWPVAGRYAAGALAVTAVVAGVQSRSPLISLAVLAGAGAVLLATRRLPDRGFDPLPESPMVAAFASASLGRRPTFLRRLTRRR
jgi:hypothetical protein